MNAGYAKVLHDGERLRRHVVDGLSLTLMIIMPLSIGIVLTAKLVEQVALGADWKGAAPYIQVCALYALFEGIGEFTHNLYIVKDRQRRFVEIMTATVLARVALVVWAGFTYGVLWAVAMFALTSFFSSALWFAQLMRMIRLSLITVIRAVWRVFAATAIMAACVSYWLTLWTDGAGSTGRVVELVAAVALGGAAYIGVLLGLWWLSGRPAGPEDHAVRTGRQLLARLGPGRRKSAAMN
jgi:O-antigen/teichoic acid export membrane protein